MTVAKVWDKGRWSQVGGLAKAAYDALGARVGFIEEKHKLYGHWGSNVDRTFNAANNHFNFGSNRIDLSAAAQEYMIEADGDSIRILVGGIYEVHALTLTYVSPAAAIRQDTHLMIGDDPIGTSLGISSTTVPYVKHHLYYKGPIGINDLVEVMNITGGRTYPDSGSFTFNQLYVSYEGAL